MKFVIFGTGGIGGFFGGKLAAGGQDVWFVARGKHLDAMKAHGLHIHSSEGDYIVPGDRMTDTPEEIGPSDVVLFCVKSYDTESAAKQLAPILTENSTVISLQNGVDNEEKIQQTIARGTVYAGTANIYSTITAPGVVTEVGGPRKLVFGPLAQAQRYDSPGTPSGKILTLHDQRGKQILSAMLAAGINAEFSADMHTELWRKFIFITAVAGLTALTRLTLGEILRVKETSAILADAMRETERIARANRANIDAGFVENVFGKLRKYENNTRSSLYYDLVHEKPLEIEALSGTVVRYGFELGIPTPVHAFVYGCLLPYHLAHMLRVSQP